MSAIADFPGIDALLKTADAVVVATIRQHIPSQTIRINDFSEFYECYINQTLKGNLQPRSQVVLRVENASDDLSLLRPLGQSTVVILFLKKHGKDKHGNEYSSLPIIGATIEIAPFGSEAVPQTGTPKARIKALIQHYRQYRARQVKHEEKLLQRVLRS
jgi:hypothetical protein